MDARGYQNYKQQSINSMTSGELLQSSTLAGLMGG